QPAPVPAQPGTVATKAGGGAAVSPLPIAVEPQQKSPGTFSYDQRWRVTKSGDQCLAMPAVDCPKPTKAGGPVPTCNPPPPIKYSCPANIDLSAPVTVVQYANRTECETEPAAVKCPPNTACNPPPPRKVPCPSRSM
nr:hypothetical protein [Myxococcota bacterium]